MADSLSNHQIEQIVTLGNWRDEGHCFLVSRDGEVSPQPADEGDEDVASEQREWTARRQRSSGGQGTSGRERASGQPGAAATSEPTGKNRLADVRCSYLAAMSEVRGYYPDLRVIEVEDGIWVVTQIFPIGRGGPTFSVCLFLPDRNDLEPKAFGFEGNGRPGRPVGPRHTNFPDASICGYSPDDGVWRPGMSPLILINLYAEWLLCQLFFQLELRWPGRQSGLNAGYRTTEFRDSEWCDCGSEIRYGTCCKNADQREVTLQKLTGTYKPLPKRTVPAEIIRFATSGWRKPPKSKTLVKRPFLPLDQARIQLIRQRLVRNAG